jgi:S1-C subfamily serine protease
MERRLVYVLALAAACVAAAVARGDERDVRLFERLSQQVYALSVNEESDAAAVATAFLCEDKDLCVTNSHAVVGVGKGARVKLYPMIRGERDERRLGPAVMARVEQLDFEADLAFLRLETAAAAEPLRLAGADRLVGPGEDVWMLGFPDGLALMFAKGMVGGHVRDVSLPGVSYLLDIAASPGSSGSPVVTASGEVIGVVTLLSGDGGGATFATALETAAVRKSLAKFRGGGDGAVVLRGLVNETMRDAKSVDARLRAFIDGGRTLIERTGTPEEIARVQVDYYDANREWLPYDDLDSVNRAFIAGMEWSGVCTAHLIRISMRQEPDPEAIERMERIIERRATKLLQWELAQTKPLLEALDDEGRSRHVTNRLRVIEETLRGRLDRVEASVDQTALDDIARFDNQQFMQMMTDMCTASALCELVVPLLEQMEGGAPRDTPAEVRQLLPKLRRQVRRTAELEQKVMPDETAGE